MLKYPKQNKDVLGSSHKIKFCIGDTTSFVWLDIFTLRVDYEYPDSIIGICTTEGEMKNYITFIYNDPRVYMDPIGLIPDNLSKDDILPNIQAARYNGNTVYMIPVDVKIGYYIYIMVVDGKYLQFYSQLDIDLDNDNELVYLDYEYINNKDKLTRQDIYDFIEQLMGEYSIWKE